MIESFLKIDRFKWRQISAGIAACIVMLFLTAGMALLPVPASADIDNTYVPYYDDSDGFGVSLQRVTTSAYCENKYRNSPTYYRGSYLAYDGNRYYRVAPHTAFLGQLNKGYFLHAENEIELKRPAGQNYVIPREGALVIPPRPAQNRLVMAEKTVTEEIEKVPKEKNFMENLEAGDTLFSKSDFGNAVEYYRKALDQRPESPVALAAIAHCRFGLGEFDVASEAIHDALGIWPELAETLQKQVGGFYGNQQRFSQIMLSLEHQADLSPGNVRKRFLAGAMHLFNRNKEAAKHHLEIAQRMLPNDPVIQSLLSDEDKETETPAENTEPEIDSSEID